MVDPFDSVAKNVQITDLSDNRTRDFSGILKGGPRQEITGPPYTDTSRPSPVNEIHNQSQHAAEFNRTVNQQRDFRSEYAATMWRKPHEAPTALSMSQSGSSNTGSGSTGSGQASEATLPSASSRPSQSPHATSSGIVPNQSPQLMMSNPPYAQSIHSQNTLGQNALRGMSHHQTQPPSTAQYGNPTGGRPAGMVPGAATGTGPASFNYPPAGQMWQQAPQQPQAAAPGAYGGYAAQAPPSGGSTAPQQMRHHSGGQLAPQFPGMPTMQAYGHQAAMYGEQTPRQYMTQNSPVQPAVTQSWSNQQPPTQQWWPNHQ